MRPARPLRELIDAAKAGKRITGDEKRVLGGVLHMYWRHPCARCRRLWPVDHLDDRNGRCEECMETVARTGET